MLRYAAVGALATAAHWATLVLLVEAAALAAWAASGIGAAVGAQVAFIGNRRFTFDHRGPLLPAWWRFMGTAALGGTVGMSLVATGAVGGTYSLWATTNLALSPVTNTWTRLLTNAIIATSPFTNLDLKATNYPQRFYLYSNP